MGNRSGHYVEMIRTLRQMSGTEIAEQLKALQGNPSESEYRSWVHSVPVLVDVIHRAGLDNLTLILEYQTPIGSRIDAVLLGQGKKTEKPLVLIIELKQWSAIEENTAGWESTVSICLSRTEHRFEDRIHPVQQTLTYAKHLRMNHSNVADGQMEVRCRQLLHNFVDKDQLFQGSYRAYAALRRETYGKGEEAQMAADLNALFSPTPRPDVVERFLSGSYVLGQVGFQNLGDVLSKKENAVMLDDQIEVNRKVCSLIDQLHSPQFGKHLFVISGPPGTGKTVVGLHAIYAYCRKYGPSARNRGGCIFALPRSRTLAQVITGASGVAPAYLDAVQPGRDLVVVDEAHRLRWNSPKQNHLTTGIFDQNDPKKNELFLLGELADRLVLFYDSIQAIRPSDIPRLDFQAYVRERDFQKRMLTKQFRVQVKDAGAAYTADDYLNGICSFLQLKQDAFDPRVFQNRSEDAYFGIADSIHELFSYVDEQRQYHPKAQCRVLAGYARPWGSRYRPEDGRHVEFDWTEDEDHRWKWNSTHENWIALPGSEEEIGSIHAIQGVDLDYVGVVIAKDLTYRNGIVTAVKENYFDTNGTPPKESFSIQELSEYVRQIYYVLLTRGISGIRIYFEDQALKRHFMETAGLS